MKDKVLILGANQETIPLVNKANLLGLETHVADNNTESPAKKFAKVAVNIDGSDVNALYNYAYENQIKAVALGVADRLVLPYSQLCEKLAVPAGSSSSAASVFSNKAKFNNLVSKYEINPIPGYIHYADRAASNQTSIDFPLIVKPSDSNSGKGLSIVQSEPNLAQALEYGLFHSTEKAVLVERLMGGDDMFFYLVVVDGLASLSISADRFTRKGENSRVCFGASYPSVYEEIFLLNHMQNFSSLLQEAGVQNGVFMISAFEEKGELYFYDPGLRLQGEAPDLHVEKRDGFNHCEFLLQIASDRAPKLDLVASASKGYFGATLWFLVRPGTIQEISGVDKIEGHLGVFKFSQRFHVGDVISDEMSETEGQVFARVYLSADDPITLKRAVETIPDIFILSEDGSSMLIDCNYSEIF